MNHLNSENTKDASVGMWEKKIDFGAKDPRAAAAARGDVVLVVVQGFCLRHVTKTSHVEEAAIFKTCV